MKPDHVSFQTVRLHRSLDKRLQKKKAGPPVSSFQPPSKVIRLEPDQELDRDREALLLRGQRGLALLNPEDLRVTVKSIEGLNLLDTHNLNHQGSNIGQN